MIDQQDAIIKVECTASSGYGQKATAATGNS